MKFIFLKNKRILVASYLLLTFFSLNSTDAQEIASNNPTPERTISPTPTATPKLNGGGALDSNHTAIIVALITTFGSISVAYIQTRKRSAAERKLEGIFRPVKTPENETRNSVMLLGIGGAGKTSLIRSIFDDPQANPNVLTDVYDLYSVKIENIRNSTSCSLFVGDYKGQDLGTLIRTFVMQQKEPYHPMAYGFITSLILVVDLFPPPSKVGEEVPGDQTDFNNKRLRENLREWNDNVVDAIFGLLTEKLKYVCLYINKFDLLASNTNETVDLAIKAYDKVSKRLQDKSSGAEFEVIVGSAQNGMGIVQLRQKLLQHSVKS